MKRIGSHSRTPATVDLARVACLALVIAAPRPAQSLHAQASHAPSTRAGAARCEPQLPCPAEDLLCASCGESGGAEAPDFLPAPKGQVQTRPAATRAIFAEHASASRRLALTFAPVVGRLVLPLMGRSDPRIGFGFALDAEVGITPWLWIIAGWQRLHYLVYAQASPSSSGDGAKPTAPGGWVRWQDLSLGIRYALDDGRVRPLLEAGAGLGQLAHPTGVADGQAGQSCATGQRCDPGLVCRENKCQAAPFASAYVGLEAQWLIARYFSLGVGARYYLSWMANRGTDMPAQWVLSLRGSMRY